MEWFTEEIVSFALVNLSFLGYDGQRIYDQVKFIGYTAFDNGIMPRFTKNLALKVISFAFANLGFFGDGFPFQIDDDETVVRNVGVQEGIDTWLGKENTVVIVVGVVAEEPVDHVCGMV
jgi:hypothetical protein